MSSLPVIKATSFKQASFICHGFFTREGGVSRGIYQALNIGLGSDDNDDHIAQNRALVAAHFGVGSTHLLSPHQCHSADVAVVDAPFTSVRPKVDALVTKTPGLVLSVATADCAPVLFADSSNGVIGAAHAGWRGAYYGILEKTVAAMERLGARRENIMAAIGPCIGKRNYEVGEEFFARFISQSSDNQRYFDVAPRKNHYLFDLAAYNIGCLAQINIVCEGINLCTYADERRFFSHRRMVHAQEVDYGRQMSAIVISKNESLYEN